MPTEISYVPAPRSPSVVYALYDVHEMSRPQLMRGLMNVMQSMYFKALTKDFVTIIPVTDVRAVPPGSAVLVYSSTVARRFIGSSSMQNYRGSVYRADGLVYIIGVGIGGMRCLLISSPKDDAQEKMVVKMFYATASDIFKAYRFNRGDFEGYAMHTDDTLDYTLIREPQEWDAAKSFMESHASEILAISFDIETAGFPTFISAFGFTLVLGTLESPRFKSYTIAMGIHDYCWHHTAMRYICSHPAPKIAHNGAYDCTVLLRYRIPVTNMLYDTMLMHHSIRCDALKSLAYVASTLLPDYVFWKGEIKGVENKGNEGTSETQLETETKDHGVPPTPEGRIVYYKYCAKDTYYTARICLEMMKLFHTTSWAVRNYCLVHFLQYRVGIFMGLAGMPIDKTKFNAFVKDICTEREQALSQLRTYAKDELFNPASTSEVQNFIYVTLGLPLPKGIRLKPEKKRRAPKQASAAAQKLLGLRSKFGLQASSSVSSMAKPSTPDLFGDDMFASFDELKEAAAKPSLIPEDLARYPTDKTAMRFLLDQNPEAREPLELLGRYRWLQKVISNYLLSSTLLVDSVNDPNVGVLLYHPSICATVTCRYGGGKSNLGWGAYHLNLPPGLWDCIKVPAGHIRYSIDYSHSDDYFVAFYSGVPAMMENVVRTDLDLHMKHASLIFQRPYDYLMEHKKDKASEAPLLRKLTKSIGHGCKYLMGGYTMYTHMGDPNICAAIDALHADVDKSSLSAKTQFASHLQDLFYAQYEGLTKWHKDVYMQLLQNPERTITVGNWTRQILSPANWFSIHSGSVAQYGQAGTSSNSNAFLRKFFRRKLDPSSYIFAQVHDAMDGFARNENEVHEIAAMMEEPITVTDIYGTTRTFSVATEAEEFYPETSEK